MVTMKGSSFLSGIGPHSLPYPAYLCHYPIQEYIIAAGRANRAPESALFTGMTKGDKPTEQQISDKLIERIVKQYSKDIDIHTLTPHGLRSTFITLALENKATLHQVQYAAGHADPRTTERYQKRKLNLDDNAVDYIRL
jgi:integrase